MIDVWLKIRDRGNLEFVLKHLNFWLATFSNRDKYRIHIYNEDVFNLPVNYNIYPILNRQQILANIECRNVNNLIERSNISHRWKCAALALAAPYFYLHNSEYVINIDADDILMFGPMDHYINRVIETMNNFNLPTMSYDYIYSHNTFDGNRNVLPHHWTFGVNISKIEQMKNIILDITNNINGYARFIRNLNIHTEANLDILMSAFLANNGRNHKYHAFITKEGFFHRGFPNFDLYSCKWRDGKFYSSFQNNERICDVHQKTIFIE